VPDHRESLSVTVALVTRNRKPELRRALESVLDQDMDAELLVIDDGSTDGTLEMLRQDFPSVRSHRLDPGVGTTVARNVGTDLATGDVIVWLDDDAYLQSPETVRQAVADFEQPRVGIVAMPFADLIGSERHVRHPAPPDDRIWVVPTFMGAVHAVRREAFRRVGGYRSDYFMYGEERDISLRLLDAGYVTRMGRSDPAVHAPSAVRSLARMDVLGRRNEIIWAWTSFPAPWHALFVVGYALKGVVVGMQVRRVRRMLRGVWRGLAMIPSLTRTPVSRRAFALDRRSRRKPRPLSEVETRLPPLSLTPPPP